MPEFGREMRKMFMFDDEYVNLNHGSFGTYPRAVRDVMRSFQDRSEARPDVFIRYDYPKLLDESRAAVAAYLHCPVETIVFVPNATTGVNTVLRNMVFAPGDSIIYFATLCGACEKTVDYITETTPATSAKIDFTYPVSDAWLVAALDSTIRAEKAAGRRPRLALFDTVVSLPGVRMPFEALTATCRAHGVLSLVDAAHGVGHLPLDLTALDPDFLVSNAHKWLMVPRGCAVFYVPLRHQAAMRSTLPTSHGYVPTPRPGRVINNPLPPSAKSAFVTNFEFVGTIDNSPYLCIPAALAFRQRLTHGGKRGEAAVAAYCFELARAAGQLTASTLGTNVLARVDAADRTEECCFSNVRLPLDGDVDAAKGNHDAAIRIAQWISQVLVREYATFIAIVFYGDAWWVRLSAQVYLDLADFEWGAGVLKKVCERVRAGEWRG
ncbi:pyridoxal phosphate-dependent transferase [Cryomyces antarcticus]